MVFSICGALTWYILCDHGDRGLMTEEVMKYLKDGYGDIDHGFDLFCS